jgi:serine protease Do
MRRSPVRAIVFSFVSAALILAGPILAGLAPPVFAQEWNVGYASSPAAEASRNREFESLARDVAAMDRELGLIKRVVRLVTPSVVHIEASPTDDSRRRTVLVEEGSGVIVQFGSRYFILTNRHVIKDSSPSSTVIKLADGRVMNPREVWSDPDTDVAVMWIIGEGLVPARLGDSAATEIGEHVLAVGSPFGLSQSVTRGIISAKGRYNLELGAGGDVKLQNFLQTDAAINPGNSGGPLINLRGEVIGINTAIASASGGNEGIGFSIPVTIAARVAQQLTETGRVVRGYLGVKFDDTFDERSARAVGLTRLVGSRVANVFANSPAEKARIRPNDVIVQFNGTWVEDGDHLVSLVQLTEAGTKVELVVYRDGAPVPMMVEIGNDQLKP